MATTVVTFTSCQVDMKLGDPKPLDTANNTEVEAELGAKFYNKDSANPLDNTGNIIGAIELQYGSNGLEAIWYVWEALNHNATSWRLIKLGTLVSSSSLNFDQFYTASMSYSSAGGEITFQMAGEQAVATGLPDYAGPAFAPRITLLNTINSDLQCTVRWTDAAFDNLYFNGALYENFNADMLDPSKWFDFALKRWIENQELEMSIQGRDHNHQISAYSKEDTAKYFQADALISSESQLAAGAEGIARVAGTYFNAKYTPNNYDGADGEVFAQVRLKFNSSGKLVGEAMVDRTDDPEWQSYTNLYYKEFSQSISLDQKYTLSVHFLPKDRKFIFKIDDESHVFNISPLLNVYPPHLSNRQLRTRVYLKNGESGYLKVLYDNVKHSRDSIIAPQFLLLQSD